jgi:hypothetical protein
MVYTANCHSTTNIASFPVFEARDHDPTPCVRWVNNLDCRSGVPL